MIQFQGEHLLPGQLGHFFVILAMVSALLSTISFFSSAYSKDLASGASWEKIARYSFGIHAISVMAIFSVIFFLCFNHYYEYMYAYKHASKELEYKYLLACIWEGQEGSFLLWAIWHVVLGSCFMMYAKKKEERKQWLSPVMGVVALAQFFLMLMILGIYFFGVRIGNSPFTLTRNEIPAPIFSRPDYLNFIKDGMGLNVLLRNYWMVIHPPVLFLGFASTIIPFAFAYAGIQTKRFGEWVKLVIPWTLFSVAVLGVGIMMGGKWAYESLSFGGYWAWDPVENASLVPWLIMVAGLHTLLIYNSTKQSLSSSYLFMILSFVFVLYSTFLTRTGILGDTSVHAFTESGQAINIMIGIFVLSFTLPMLGLYFRNKKHFASVLQEEDTSSREFWMFIGSLVIFLSALFVILVTSIPVYGKTPLLKDLILKLHGGPLALPEDPEFLYNKVMVLVAIILGILTAISQYFKYKHTDTKYFLAKILWPTMVAALITLLVAIFGPLTYEKHGPGFLVAIYIAFFAMVYAVVANAMYIFTVLKGNLKFAGASIAHFGFGLMIVGVLISSANKKVLSNSNANGLVIPAGTDPMTRKQDNQLENLTLLRSIPAKMGDYDVTYLADSSSLKESGRIFYKIHFSKTGKGAKEDFNIMPDLYMMKNSNISPNPDSKTFLTEDVFTYITNAIDKTKVEDTATFEVKELALKENTMFSFGYVKVDSVNVNPEDQRVTYTNKSDNALMARITITLPDSMHVMSKPVIQVKDNNIIRINDTLYAQNMIVQFEGVDTETRKVRIGVKRSSSPMDYITVKTYLFPYINLVWVGLVILALGTLLSMLKRWNASKMTIVLTLLLSGAALFYMFLIAS